MRKWVARATLAGALAFVLAASLGFDPARDMDSAWKAYGMGDLDQAMRLARRSMALDGQKRHRQGLELLIKSARAMGRPAEAVKYADLLLAVDPSSAWANLQRARLFGEAKDASRALRYFDLGLDLARKQGLKPLVWAPDLARRGEILLSLGRREKAWADARESLRLIPQEPEPYMLVSRLLEDQGEFLAALEALEQGTAMLYARDRFFFLSEENKDTTRRLILLRHKAEVDDSRPLFPGLEQSLGGHG